MSFHTPQDSIPAVWGPLLVAALTIAALVWFSWQYALAVASTRWPKAQGKIVRSWVEQFRMEDPPNYSPLVEYIYDVGGLRYTSHTIRLTGRMSVSKSRAERIAATYPQGGAVDVWYDPEKPGRATLIPGGATRLLVGIVVVSIVGPCLTLAATPAGRLFLKSLGLHEEQ